VPKTRCAALRTPPDRGHDQRADRWRPGLVQSDTTIIDAASELGTGVNFTDEQIALSAVVTTTHPGSTIVAVRCIENPDDDLRTINGKLTALQVPTVTGP
jgi:hypothetical protein